MPEFQFKHNDMGKQTSFLEVEDSEWAKLCPSSIT